MAQWSPSQSLNDWIRMLRGIYDNRNSERDKFKIHAHLTEVVAGLYKAIRKGSNHSEVESFLTKSFAWYAALTSALDFRDVEATVWHKYPAACPYCLNSRCTCAPDAQLVLDTAALRKLQFQANDRQRPARLAQWQAMFRDIYGTPARLLISPGQDDLDPRITMLHGVTRLFEELGELAEAIRLEHIFPVALRTELADVFAWIIALANSLPYLTKDPDFSFEHTLWERYPGKCTYCFKEQCNCLNVRVRPSLVASAGDELGLDMIEDPLTGLQHKESFEHDLAEAVANATDREPLSLLLIDLDHFKDVNDSFGHAFGDQVLRDMATIFRKVLTSYGGNSYRWGGEEFAGLLLNRSKEEAKACAERVRNEIMGTPIITPTRGRHQQTVSVGVVTFNGALGIAVPVLARTLFDVVDKAVYDAKHSGRNRTVIGNIDEGLLFGATGK